MPTYGQFCPVAKTSELLCERWMPLILRELMCGSARFSEIERGVPLISPALLTKRLRQLTSAGVAERTATGRDITYALTPAGWELYPIIEAMGIWGQRWARSRYGPDELDPSFLMWDMRRMLAPTGLADRPTVIEFRIRGGPPRKTRYWLVVEDTGIDLSLIDPQREVDLCVEATLKVLTLPSTVADNTLTALAKRTVSTTLPKALYLVSLTAPSASMVKTRRLSPSYR